MTKLRLLVAAGGTGGHFYPAAAVLEALRERVDVQPLFVGTSRGIESRLVPQMGEELEVFDVSPLNGVRGMALLRSLAKLPRAGVACVRALRRFRPDVLLSVGGYVAGPVTALASAMRVPTALIEPNAIPGLTNRLLAPLVSRAYLTYSEAERYFRKGVPRVYGSPVRRAFVERARAVSDARGQVPHVLIFGGSQGARALNDALPSAVAHALSIGSRFTVTHQTGAAAREAVEQSYRAKGIDAEVVPFIDDMATAMSRADLLVCRSGAGTVSELCVLGRPAVMIPLPTAADDHQRKNAEAIAARGAGVCVPQSELSPDSLGRTLSGLLRDRLGLAAMAERARGLGTPDAAHNIADDLLTIVRR